MDEFIDRLRTGAIENQRLWEARPWYIKLYDALKTKIKHLYWRFVDA
jgi:hypothetical protein